MQPTNLFVDLSAACAEERLTTLASGGSFRLERIVSSGHRTPPGEWYDQPLDEWVVLLRGSAGLRIAGEDDVTALRPGDALLIPARVRHRVEWTDPQEPTLWLALHFRS